jgi:integrase/recombinase XerC
MLSITHQPPGVNPDPPALQDHAPTPVPGFSGGDRLRELMEAWTASLTANTRRAYAADWTALSEWLGMTGAPSAAAWLFAQDAGTANHTVLRFKAHMTEHKLSAATIGRRLAAIKSLNTAARLVGLVPWTIEVKGPRAEGLRDTRGPGAAGYSSMKQATRADDSPRGYRDRAIIAMAYEMGLRRNEIASLGLEHLEIETTSEHGITVRRAVVAWVLPKGHAQRKKLGIPLETSRAILAWVDRRGEAPGPLFLRLDRGAHTVTEPRPMSGQAIADLVAKRGREAGLARKTKPHGLRHAGVTEAWNKTRDAELVMEFARHSNYNTTRRYIDNARDNYLKVASIVAGD